MAAAITAVLLLPIGLDGFGMGHSPSAIAQTVEERKKEGDRLLEQDIQQQLETRPDLWEQALRIYREIGDRMIVQPALEGRFLRFSYKALAGDSYESEGYFWYNAASSRYQWWEFSRVGWPVREHEGQRSGNQLISEEHTPERQMRLTFTFVDQNTLSMTEGFLNGDQFKPYAVVKFQRQIQSSR